MWIWWLFLVIIANLGNTLSLSDVVIIGDSFVHRGASTPDGFINFLNRIQMEFSFTHVQLRKETSNPAVAISSLNNNASVIIICIGIDNILSASSNEISQESLFAFEVEIIQLIEIVKATWQSHLNRIILMPPALLGEKNDGENGKDDWLEEVAALYHRIALELRLEFLDIRSLFLTILEEVNVLNLPSAVLTFDGIHFNKQGNAVIADVIYNFIVKGQVPTTEECLKHFLNDAVVKQEDLSHNPTFYRHLLDSEEADVEIYLDSLNELDEL